MSLVVCFSFLLATFIMGFNEEKWKGNTILNWDIAGYHFYLPALFIYDDIEECKFYSKIDTKYRPTGDVKYYALQKHSTTGYRVNKYSSGVSIFQFPLFFAAHIYANFTDTYLPDGYSSPYQLAILLSSILFSFLGLLVLRKFLKESGFRESVIFFTLLILSFGTNLYSYTAYQPGMGHPYSFFLYGCTLLLTQRLFLKYKPVHFFLLGLAIGFAILIRPVDIFVILIPFLWSLPTLKKTYIKLFSEHKLSILLALIAVLIPWIPQLLYWKATTGAYLFYSYGEEGFNFANPEIIQGLFSFRKGWFIYTPLALLGFVGLLISLKDYRYREYSLVSIAFYALSFFVIFSWHQWFYGGSFGSRVMINSLPLLAIPISILFEKILRLRLLIAPALLIVGFFIYLNIFQTWQYNRAIIHWDSMNKEYYWKVFLKDNCTDEDRKLL